MEIELFCLTGRLKQFKPGGFSIAEPGLPVYQGLACESTTNVELG